MRSACGESAKPTAALTVTFAADRDRGVALAASEPSHLRAESRTPFSCATETLSFAARSIAANQCSPTCISCKIKKGVTTPMSPGGDATGSHLVRSGVSAGCGHAKLRRANMLVLSSTGRSSKGGRTKEREDVVACSLSATQVRMSTAPAVNRIPAFSMSMCHTW